MEEPTKEQLKKWEKKWDKHYKSLPKRVIFKQGGLQLTFYKDEFGSYSTEPSLKLSLWQRIKEFLCGPMR